MYEEGTSFDEALKDAQLKGFAESDPTLDVSGLDAAYKAIILSQEIFRQSIALDQVQVQGIEDINAEMINSAKSKAEKIKLVATLCLQPTFEIVVRPEVVNPDDLLYNVDNEFNAVEVWGELSGPQLIVGKGAGSLPTGIAVLSDLMAIMSQKREVVADNLH